VRETLQSPASLQEESITTASDDGGGNENIRLPELDASLDPVAYSANNALLFGGSSNESASDSNSYPKNIVQLTHTPAPSKPHYDLGEDATSFSWIPSEHQRTCTLCLDPLRDPSVTTCGHVFCWRCVSDWCRERAECPLCRQQCLVQHILPLRW